MSEQDYAVMSEVARLEQKAEARGKAAAYRHCASMAKQFADAYDLRSIAGGEWRRYAKWCAEQAQTAEQAK